MIRQCLKRLGNSSVTLCHCKQDESERNASCRKAIGEVWFRAYSEAYNHSQAFVSHITLKVSIVILKVGQQGIEIPFFNARCDSSIKDL